MKRIFLSICLAVLCINSYAVLSRLHMRHYDDRAPQAAQQQAHSRPQAESNQPWYERVFPRRKESAPSRLGDDFAQARTGDDAHQSEQQPMRPQLDLDRDHAMNAARPTERPSREAPGNMATLAPNEPALPQRDPTQLPMSQPVTRIAHVYSIQLIGSGNKAKIQQFLNAHGYQHKARIISERRGGRTWYAAVVGQYATKDEARMDLARLPHRLRANQPWIKARDIKHTVQATRTTHTQHHTQQQAQQHAAFEDPNGFVEVNITG